MRTRRRGLAMPIFAATVIAVSSCTPDESSDSDDDASAPAVGDVAAAATVPQTPFCRSMTELARRLETDTTTPGAPLIIEVYRDVIDDAPPAIADDMKLVIEALERGLPVPTDPPVTFARATTTTTETPSSAPATTSPTTGPTTDTVSDDATSTTVGADVGFNEATSPTERIADYVGFECRGTDNNPGPPATQPLTEPTDEDG